MTEQAELIDSLCDGLEQTTPLCVIRLALKWLGVSILYGIIVGAIIGMRSDMDAAMQDMHFGMEMAFCSVTWVLAAFLAMRCAIPRECGRWFYSLPCLLLAAVFILLAIYSDISADTLQHVFSRSHLFGTLELLALSLLPIIYGVYLIRRAAPTAQPMAGAMLVLSSAMLASIIHHVTSEGMHAANQLFWCYTPVALLMVFGMLAARRLFRW